MGLAPGAIILLALQLVAGQIIVDITAHSPTKEAIQSVDKQTGRTFVQRQREHATAVVHNALDRRARVITNVPAADALNTYTAPITIGSGRSAQSYDLLIDTGSSYTWVGSDKPYVKTSDARDTGRTFTIRYGSGTAEGEHYTANLQFTGFSGSTMKNQGFGVASSSSGFGNVDGILGIGPTSLSSGTVSGLGQIPTVIDTLKRQGRIPNAIVAASFTPNTRGDTENRGSLALGGTDPSKFNAGTLVYTSKVDSNPYWGAKINKFTYSTSRSTQTLGAANPIGIVDTGTTLMLLPADAFKAYMASIPGAYIASDTGLMMVPRSSYGSMGNLTFFWANKPFVLIPDAQLMPPALGQLFEASNPNNDFVSIVASSGGAEFTVGMMALTRFYSVFDTPHKRIGLAYTSSTFQRTAGISATQTKSRQKAEHHKAPVSGKPKSPKKRKGKRAVPLDSALARHRLDAAKRSAQF